MADLLQIVREEVYIPTYFCNFAPVKYHISLYIMYYVKKRMEIAGCHQLDLPYESKCRNMHGHNWVVTVYCKSKTLNACGMVVDFKHIKDKIHGYLDHGNFNELLPFNPTAENLAFWICSQIAECYRVDVEESSGNSATYIDDESETLC